MCDGVWMFDCVCERESAVELVGVETAGRKDEKIYIARASALPF